MKNWKKLLAWAIPLILILSLVALAQTSNFTNVSVSGWLNSTSPVRMDGTNIIKTMTFLIDSLGYDADHLIFTMERGITVLRGDVLCKTAVTTESCSVILSTTGSTFRINVLKDASVGSQSVDASFAAAAVCTLSTSDFTQGSNGTWTQVLLQYTDY